MLLQIRACDSRREIKEPCITTRRVVVRENVPGRLDRGWTSTYDNDRSHETLAMASFDEFLFKVMLEVRDRLVPGLPVAGLAADRVLELLGKNLGRIVPVMLQEIV
jgi:hypothetical protein